MSVFNDSTRKYHEGALLKMIEISNLRSSLGNKQAIPNLASDIVTIMEACILAQGNAPLHLLLNTHEHPADAFVGLYRTNEQALEKIESLGGSMEDYNNPYTIQEVRVQ